MDIEKLIEDAGQNPVQIQIIERRARKWWTCEICKESIQPGAKYLNRVVRIAGDPISEPYASEHFCLSCELPQILKIILERQRHVSEKHHFAEVL